MNISRFQQDTRTGYYTVEVLYNNHTIEIKQLINHIFIGFSENMSQYDSLDGNIIYYNYIVTRNKNLINF